MRTGQANLGNRGDASILVILNILKARGALVCGLQEAGDRRAVIERWCQTNGWESWFGNGSPGASSTPIIWDKSLVVANLGTREATPATNAGRGGAGPDVVKAKVWNHVRVHAHGEAPFVFINGHLPASLYLPRRRALAKKQIAVLADMVEQRKGKVAVVAVGDFNARPSAAIFKPLRKLGMKQNTKQATHGRRTIDLTWTLGVNGRAEVVNVPSDHDAVVLSLR